MYTGPVDFAKYICIPPECFNGITLYGSRLSLSQELPLYSLMVITELVTIATRYPALTPVGSVFIVNIWSTGSFQPASSSLPIPVAPVSPVSPLGPVEPVAPVAPVAPVFPVSPLTPCGRHLQYRLYLPLCFLRFPKHYQARHKETRLPNSYRHHYRLDVHLSVPGNYYTNL